jgi:prepilin-type N-terminal cleavage/methylation domain-containing protein
MSSRCQGRRGSAGFSLVEVLIALAVAAMMTAVLLRYIAGTRANAARIGEALEMATLSDTLLARISSGPGLQPGLTNGKTGPFAWRVEVQPVAFTAIARTVHERKAVASPDGAAETTKAKAANNPALGGREASSAQGAADSKWMPYRVAITIETPSGRRHVADTVRIGPPPGGPQR